MDCKRCKGIGKTWSIEANGGKEITCPDCKGTGKIEEYDTSKSRVKNTLKDVMNTLKRRWIYIAAVLVLLGSGYGGYRFYIYHSNRYLREAKVLESIGDYQKAEEKYRQHLLKHPDDLDARFDLAFCLDKQRKMVQKLEVLKYIESKTRKDKEKQELYERAKSLIALTHSTIAAAATELASRTLEEKKFKEARTHYEKAFSHLGDYRRYSDYECKSEEDGFKLWLYEYPLAQRWADIAFTYWLQSKYDKARNEIGYRYVFPPLSEEVKKWRFYCFASKVEALGDEVFNKKKWKDTRLHWEEALNNYIKYDEQSENVPRMHYNIAVTYFNQENYGRAKQLLKKLAKDFPKHNPKGVSKLIKDCETGSTWKKKATLGKRSDVAYEQASEAFDGKQWAAARDFYRQAIELATEAGMPQSSHYIAGCYYNIAICYFNQKRYAEARQMMMELRAEYPNYYRKNKESIDDIIYKTERWGY